MGGNGDVNRARAGRGELPELGSTQVAENSIASACLYRREPAPLPAECDVANCIYAVVEAVKAAGDQAAVDAGVSEPTPE